MDDNNKNSIESASRPQVMANPGTNAARADAMKEDKEQKRKKIKIKKTSTDGLGALLSTRLEGFSFAWLSWALGIMLIGAAWFAFDSGQGNPDFSLSTNWFPKFTAVIGLAIMIVMIVKISLNWRQFKKLAFLPHVIAQIALIPIIIIIFGEVLMQSAATTSEGVWAAGAVFYGLGVFITAILMGWYIYVCVITFIHQKTPLTKIDGAYIIPLCALGFAMYVGDNFINSAQVLLWIFWVITFILGGLGALILIYRYLVLGSKTSETLHHFGYIILLPALLLMGMARIYDATNNGILNAHSLIFLMVLFGIGCQGFISIYVLMATKNACFIKNEHKELKYSQELSKSVLPLSMMTLATACFATSSGFNLEFAQFTFVQIAFTSVLILYTGVANSMQTLNALTNNWLGEKINNKYVKIFV